MFPSKRRKHNRFEGVYELSILGGSQEQAEQKQTLTWTIDSILIQKDGWDETLLNRKNTIKVGTSEYYFSIRIYSKSLVFENL